MKDPFNSNIKVRKNGRILPFGAIQVIHESHPDHKEDFGGQMLWSEDLLPYTRGDCRASISGSSLDVTNAAGSFIARIPRERFAVASVSHGVVARSGVVMTCGDFGDRYGINERALARFEENIVTPFEQMRCLCPERFVDVAYVIAPGMARGENVFVVSLLRTGDILLFKEDGTSIPCACGQFASQEYWEAGNASVVMIDLTLLAEIIKEHFQ